MHTLYKLTRQDGTTHKNYLYGVVGMVHKKNKKAKEPQLCSSDVFHAYRNKNLAFLLNPIHANIKNPKLWKIRGDIVCKDFGKVGSFYQKVVQQLDYPSWVGSKEENRVRIMFAILCAESTLKVYENRFPKDARVREAILAARKYLNKSTDASRAAYADAAYAAAYTADADAAACAAYAADADARAAYAAYAAYAADAAACAAYAADAGARAAYADAAYAAAYTADAASRAADAADAAYTADMDLSKLADQAVNLIFKG